VSIIGEEAHIVSPQPDGPRYDDMLPADKRNLFDNLLILCKICHKIVDDGEKSYTTERLQEIKRQHESEIRESTGSGDPAKERDDLIYAGYVDEWATAVDLHNWESWSCGFLSGDAPHMETQHDSQLRSIRTWLLGRVWPGRYLLLEDAFHNFRHVLQDLLNTFHLYCDDPYGDKQTLRTRKFYSERWVSQKEYDRKLAEYETHRQLIEDLVLELTRAANYICDRVRQYISPTFRMKEGRILAHTGMDINLHEYTLVVEYRDDDRVARPYPGLAKFLEIRKSRDFYFGVDAMGKRNNATEQKKEGKKRGRKRGSN
jgi:hypothetical protein